MPLIIFVGISSAGALFLIVFIAQICRDDRHREGTTAVSRPPSTIHLALAAGRSHKKDGSVLVLRQTINHNGPNRPTCIPGRGIHAQSR